VFARYSLIAPFRQRLAPAASLPDFLVSAGGTESRFPLMFYAYAALGVGVRCFIVESRMRARGAKPHAPLGPSRGTV